MSDDELLIIWVPAGQIIWFQITYNFDDLMLQSDSYG